MAIFPLFLSSLLGLVLTVSAFIAGANVPSLLGVYFAPSLLCVLMLWDSPGADRG